MAWYRQRKPLKKLPKIASWADGTDEEIVAAVAAADAGEINLADCWKVGDTRAVSLPAMSATYAGESHVAQTVILVLLNAGGKTLANGKECNFVVGLLDCLKEKGYVNKSSTNTGSWEDSRRRKWCNNTFKTAMMSTGIGAIFKQHYNITATEYNSSTTLTSTDWFALPAEREVCGEIEDAFGNSGGGYANDTEQACTDIIQFSYYVDQSHRKKRLQGTNTIVNWWERSPCKSGSSYFCACTTSGTANYYYASNSQGLAPFGCI